jgi:hypothetical protein
MTAVIAAEFLLAEIDTVYLISVAFNQSLIV